MSLSNTVAQLLGGVSQAGRPLALTTPLGPDVLLLERFEGTESISQPFRFRMSMVASELAKIPFDQVLGKNVTVRLNLADGSVRFWNGIIGSFGQGGPVAGPEAASRLVRYQGELVPQVWLLRRRVQSRVFARMTVPEIIDKVFGELSGLHYQLRLSGTYPNREFVVQYHESDFAFISRLMEEEGIYYFFTHTADAHALILADSPPSHPDVAAPTALAYQPLQARLGGLRITRWQSRQRVQSSKFTLWDYSFEMADSNLGANQIMTESVQVGTANYKLRLDHLGELEEYQYPGNFAHCFDGIGPDGSKQPDQLKELHKENTRRANLRMQERAAQALRQRGAGNCGNLAPGHKFSVVSDWADAGPYVVTAVRHVASQTGFWRSNATPVKYRNRFHCLPLAVPFRPRRRTPKPRITSTQTAVVVGPTGQDVFTDTYGRVQVQFYWDRGGVAQIKGQDGQDVLNFKYWSRPTPPGQMILHSRWVRVAQNWAGRGWGQLTVPRIGQEVIVGFLEGDPDQPIVLGSVYDSVNLPPFTLPDHALASGIKTHTAGADGNHYNGLAFNDTSGKENAQLQAQRNMVLNAKQHLVTNVGGNYYENIVGARIKFTGQPPALGDVGSDPGGSDKNPWNWKIGDVSASIGKTLSMVFGEDTKATCGISASLTLGNKFDFLINPAIIASWVPGFAGIAGFMAPLLGMFAGRNEFILGPKSEFSYWPKTSVMMNNKNDYAPGPAEHTILRRFLEISSILMTAEWLAMGGAGQHLSKGWDDSNDNSKAMTITGGAIGVLAAAVMVAVQATLVKAKGLQDAATAARNATTSQNASNAVAAAKAAAGLATAPLAGAAAVPIVPAGVPPQYKMESYDGPMLAKFSDYNLVGTTSVLIVSGTGTRTVPLADPARNSISMDPLRGLTLSNNNPVGQPKIILGPLGDITISVRGSQIILHPVNGITLKSVGVTTKTIKIGPTAISLSDGYGPAAKTITIDPTEISMNVGPKGGSIKLQNTGTTLGGLVVTAEPETCYILKTKNLMENISGVAMSKGAVRQIAGA